MQVITKEEKIMYLVKKGEVKYKESAFLILD